MLRTPDDRTPRSLKGPQIGRKESVLTFHSCGQRSRSALHSRRSLSARLALPVRQRLSPVRLPQTYGSPPLSPKGSVRQVRLRRQPCGGAGMRHDILRLLEASEKLFWLHAEHIRLISRRLTAPFTSARSGPYLGSSTNYSTFSCRPSLHPV